MVVLGCDRVPCFAWVFCGYYRLVPAGLAKKGLIPFMMMIMIMMMAAMTVVAMTVVAMVAVLLQR